MEHLDFIVECLNFLNKVERTELKFESQKYLSKVFENDFTESFEDESEYFADLLKERKDLKEIHSKFFKLLAKEFEQLKINSGILSEEEIIERAKQLQKG